MASGSGHGTRAACVIVARRQAIYRAILDPQTLARWLPPVGMTGVVHELDARGARLPNGVDLRRISGCAPRRDHARHRRDPGAVP
jgi:hypothetical protein